MTQAIVREVRRLQPQVVITSDPTPTLRQHRDHRLLGRNTLDVAWPIAGTAILPELGPPHETREAWLYGGPAPDLFVSLSATVRDRLASSACRPPTRPRRILHRSTWKPRHHPRTAP